MKLKKAEREKDSQWHAKKVMYFHITGAAGMLRSAFWAYTKGRRYGL